MDRRVWQISAGPADRCYADVFLRHGVGLIGPGDAGPWSPERPDDDFEGSTVRRFASEPQVGDPIVLRVATSIIRAVGLVASGYSYLHVFDDVNGLDLQHARRIRWFSLPRAHDFGEAAFGAPAPRFGQVAHEAVLDYVRRFVNSPPTAWQEAALPVLPAEEPVLSDHEAPERVRPIVAQARDLQPLYMDRDKFGLLPTEDELVAHFVVPMLGALGWRPELVGIKWQKVDVALFGSLPRSPESCRIVIEAKRMGAGVEGALAQAVGYVQDLGLHADVVVTDGFRYRLYRSDWAFQPSAYANLVRLKRPALALFTRLSYA